MDAAVTSIFSVGYRYCQPALRPCPGFGFPKFEVALQGRAVNCSLSGRTGEANPARQKIELSVGDFFETVKRVRGQGGTKQDVRKHIPLTQAPPWPSIPASVRPPVFHSLFALAEKRRVRRPRPRCAPWTTEDGYERFKRGSHTRKEMKMPRLEINPRSCFKVALQARTPGTSCPRYASLVKNEVQRAIWTDEDEAGRCSLPITRNCQYKVCAIRRRAESGFQGGSWAITRTVY